AVSACCAQSLRIAAIRCSVVNWFWSIVWFSLSSCFLVLALSLDPGFELADSKALHRQLDMGVEGIHVFARRVAHEGLAHVGHHAGFHEPRVERVAKIVKPEVADARAADGCLP